MTGAQGDQSQTPVESYGSKIWSMSSLLRLQRSETGGIHRDLTARAIDIE